MSTEQAPQFPENKWTTQDKLVQLRNVVKLQEREVGQSKVGAVALVKKQSKLIKQLCKENDHSREELDICIRGDDLRRRTTMRNNRNYQLAYQRLPTQKIVENISQVLFNKTKDLNKLRYKRREMENYLIKLKLQLQEMKCAKKFVMKTWKEQEVSNRVQNMLVKQNAARTVKETYQKMIKILRDDAQSFDKILANLKADRLIQSKCILRATEMGQKATDELTSLREEYKVEEKNILTLMKRMDMTAKGLKSDLERITASCRTVIRTESITRFGSIQIDEDEEHDDSAVTEAQLTKELGELESALKKLQQVTEVLSFDEIYPRIEQQVRQKALLLKQLDEKNLLRSNLLDQRNQLEALYESLEHTMLPTTEWYRGEKSRLKEEAIELDEGIQETDRAVEECGAMVLCIRMGLLSLSRKLDRIDTSNNYTLHQSSLEDSSPEGVLSTLPLPETNALEIMDSVNKKLDMLVHQIRSIGFTLSHEAYLKGKRAFELKIISQNVVEHKEDEYELAMTEMLEELGATEDPLVPTRLEIKSHSAKIVDLYGTEHHAPEPKSRPKPKKFKK